MEAQAIADKERPLSDCEKTDMQKEIKRLGLKKQKEAIQNDAKKRWLEEDPERRRGDFNNKFIVLLFTQQKDFTYTLVAAPKKK